MDFCNDHSKYGLLDGSLKRYANVRVWTIGLPKNRNFETF